MTLTELPSRRLSSAGRCVCSVRGEAARAISATRGTDDEGILVATPPEEPEPSDAVCDAPLACVIVMLLTRPRSLAGDGESGPRYGSCLQYVVLLTCLKLPLHFA
jgi:hypothetical protein